MRIPYTFYLLPMVLLAPWVNASPLLNGAIQPWLGERDSWAFTQQVREFDQGVVKEERVERYDPSQPEMRRWTLRQLNGRPPTPAESTAFTERKGRKSHTARPLTDYIDFDHGTVQAATPEWIRYEVPLREVNRFIPVDKITLAVTVNRASRAIEQVKAVLREPLRIGLGVARVTDVTFDLHFDHDKQRGDMPSGPASVQPTGTAQATLFKFGKRAEFAWSDFTRVIPYCPNQEIKKSRR